MDPERLLPLQSDHLHKFESHATSQADLSILNTPESILFEGDAGIITMDSSQYYCEIRTNELDFNQFPKNLNIPAYIELNYANNFPFSLGNPIGFFSKIKPLLKFPFTWDSFG